MRTLHNFCQGHNLPKSSVHRQAQAMGISTTNGLSDDDQRRLLEVFKPEAVAQAAPPPEAPVTATVTLVDEREHGLSLDFQGGEMVFNPAGILGSTNGTADAIAQMDALTSALKDIGAGVRAFADQARQEYLSISTAARQVEGALADTQQVITQARAEASILETMKLDQMNKALDAKARLDALRQGGGQA